MALPLPPMSALSSLHNYMTDPLGQPADLSSTPSLANFSPSKRPKLSLQTSLSNPHGAWTRGAATNPAQSTYTPTTANTLSNTWDLSIRPSPVSRTESPRPVPLKQQLQLPYLVSLPFGIKPILKNSPLPPRDVSVSASPRDSRRKVFFPQPKKVTFRNRLEDFIENKNYVARHCDLSSSDDEASADEDQSGSPPLRAEEASAIGTSSPPPSRKRKDRRDSAICLTTAKEEKVQVPSSMSSTPVPSRDRKRRRWQWNIAKADTIPVQVSQAPEDATPASSDSAGDDSDETAEIDPRPDFINTNTDTDDELSSQNEPQLGVVRNKVGEERVKPSISIATETGTSAEVASRPSTHDDKVDQNS